MQIVSSRRQDTAADSRTHGIPDQWLFCYGTLMVATVFGCVTGVARPVAMPATLAGFERRALSGKVYPGARKQPGAQVHGVIYRTPRLVLPVLDRHEGEMYLREAVPVQTAAGAIDAWCYLLRPRYCHLMLKTDWSLQTFCNKHLQACLDEARQTARAPR